jgi:transcriptional regulator with XRE-family HTH domain
VGDRQPQQLRALGELIRTQRELTRMSLRELAAKAGVSNPYISQLERGMHEPSIRVLRAIASALDTSADLMLTRAGLIDGDHRAGEPSTEQTIANDRALTPSQRDALLSVYRNFVAANEKSR